MRPNQAAVSFVCSGDWAILEEYMPGNVRTQGYLQGYHGLVKTLVDNIYYYQDELGSTSHIASASGVLLEYYKYNLYGKPKFYDALNNPLSTSNYYVVDLGNGGARWMPQLGLYDDRNRFMSPDLGRFLQPDPIGFKGDASNLYRYCGNDWANRTDSMGLQEVMLSSQISDVPFLETELPRPILETFGGREGEAIPKELVDEAVRLNRGKHEVRLPDGRRVGLRGRDHFSKSQGNKRIPTPHVRDPKQFKPPYDKMFRGTNRDPRPAKPDDIRDVIKHLQDKINEGRGEKTRPDMPANQDRSQGGPEKASDAKQQEPAKEAPKTDITPNNAGGQPGQTEGVNKDNG